MIPALLPSKKGFIPQMPGALGRNKDDLSLSTIIARRTIPIPLGAAAIWHSQMVATKEGGIFQEYLLFTREQTRKPDPSSIPLEWLAFRLERRSPCRAGLS